MTASQLFTDVEMNIRNWTGNLGAFMAQLLVKEGFGLGAYYIVIILFSIGIQLGTGISLLKPWSMWKYGFFSLLWLPLLLAMLFQSDPYNILGGGVLGHFVHFYLKGLIGTAGIVIALLFSFAAWLVTTFNLTFSPRREKKHSKDKLTPSKSGGPLTDQYNTVEFAVDEEEEDDAVKKNLPKQVASNQFKAEEAEGSVELEVDLPDNEVKMVIKWKTTEKLNLNIVPQKKGRNQKNVARSKGKDLIPILIPHLICLITSFRTSIYSITMVMVVLVLSVLSWNPIKKTYCRNFVKLQYRY